MYLIPCNHNNHLANFPESYDRIFLTLIHQNFPKIVYQDRSTVLRASTSLSNLINPYCPNCKTDVINNFTNIGSSITEIDTIFETLRLKASNGAKSIDQCRRKWKLGGQERGRIVQINMNVPRYPIIHCFDSQELEACLAWALVAGLLDVGDEYTPRLNPAAKWAVDELERVDLKTDGDDNPKDDCVVCLEGLLKKEKKIVRMPCKHEFHEDCIVVWLIKSHVCPLCRFELPLEGSN